MTAQSSAATMPIMYDTGHQLVFNRAAEEADGALELVDVDGGEPDPLGDGRYEDAGRFSTDGERVATSGDGRIVLLDVDGKIVEEITDTPGNEIAVDWGGGTSSR